MQNTIPAQISYNNDREQTILFKRLDAGWLVHNIEATRALVAQITTTGVVQDRSKGENIIFREVSAQTVINFLNNYNFHERRQTLTSKLLTNYIQTLNKVSDLLKWNVVIRSAKNNLQKIDLGSGVQVHTVERNRRNKPGDDADIGVLMSRGDRIIDLNLGPNDLNGKTTDKALQELRPPGIGLLIIYPISKDSSVIPVKEGKGSLAREPLRLPMQAVEHLIGLGMVFPDSTDKSRGIVHQNYMTVDLSQIPREELEWDIDQEDI